MDYWRLPNTQGGQGQPKYVLITCPPIFKRLFNDGFTPPTRGRIFRPVLSADGFLVLLKHFMFRRLNGSELWQLLLLQEEEISWFVRKQADS